MHEQITPVSDQTQAPLTALDRMVVGAAPHISLSAGGEVSPEWQAFLDTTWDADSRIPESIAKVTPEAPWDMLDSTEQAAGYRKDGSFQTPWNDLRRRVVGRVLSDAVRHHLEDVVAVQGADTPEAAYVSTFAMRLAPHRYREVQTVLANEPPRFAAYRDMQAAMRAEAQSEFIAPLPETPRQRWGRRLRSLGASVMSGVRDYADSRSPVSSRLQR